VRWGGRTPIWSWRQAFSPPSTEMFSATRMQKSSNHHKNLPNPVEHSQSLQSTTMPKESKHSRGRREEKKKRKRDNGEDETQDSKKRRTSQDAADPAEDTGMQLDVL